MGGPLSVYFLRRLQNSVQQFNDDPKINSLYPYPEDLLKYLAKSMGIVP